MVLVWRGFGLTIPILTLIVGATLGSFFDDTRVVNTWFTGWVLLVSGVLSLGPAFLTFGGEEKGEWARHSFFLIPVVFWPVLLGGGGLALLIAHLLG